MTILEEIENEVWHILASIYTYQELEGTLTASLTRYELGNQLVALNAILEILVVRIARLADRTKGVRSVSMLLKRGSFQASAAEMQSVADEFLLCAKPVLKIRHEQIAHMKPNVLSSFEPRNLPAEALKAAETLIKLVDLARGNPQSYIYKVGSMEPPVDLKASVAARKRILINKLL